MTAAQVKPVKKTPNKKKASAPKAQEQVKEPTIDSLKKEQANLTKQLMHANKELLLAKAKIVIWEEDYHEISTLFSLTEETLYRATLPWYTKLLFKVGMVGQ